jgi:hemin uptake protein HemP
MERLTASDRLLLQTVTILIYDGAMDTNESRPSDATPSLTPPEPGLIRAADLFGRSTVVYIEYRGERYQLRQTRNDKLILTK